MNKEEFVLFLQMNPYYRKYVVLNFWDKKQDRFKVVKKDDKYIVLYYSDKVNYLFESVHQEEAYDFLVNKLSNI